MPRQGNMQDQCTRRSAQYCKQRIQPDKIPFIPVYFYIFGLFSIYMFDACRRHAPQKMLLLYLAMKMMKMILSLILLLIYCLAVREEARAFLLTFISFYLLYLIYETWFFFSFEVNLKRKKKNKNKNETVA